MAWGRLDDMLAMSVKIRGLIETGSAGQKAIAERAESAGAWALILSTTCAQGGDGFFTQDVADMFARPVAFARLLRSKYGKAPLVHRREDGEDCECLKARGGWKPDYDYLFHDFLMKNPAKAETERERAKSANRRDARLKKLVYDRDGGCCRYCRSGPLSPKAGKAKDRRKALQFDHVDPDKAAGPDGDGYVTSCARCNREKGERTPDEADMPLLPEPTPAQRAALLARELLLCDMPASQDEDSMLTLVSATQSATDQQKITDPVTDRITDTTSDPDSDRNAHTAAEPRPEQAEQQHGSAANSDPRGAGSGRAGPRSDVVHPAAGPPAQPPRTAAAPDIYHRRSRGPSPGIPLEISADPEWPPTWPPGSVPVPTEPLQPAIQHAGGTA